jgi:hypothetical protein
MVPGQCRPLDYPVEMTGQVGSQIKSAPKLPIVNL